MARIEKTVFVGYRRKDISWALAVYQYLTARKYDVFFDYSSLSVGDFEQIIVSNIRARAHFVLILTPTTLDQTSEPGDWLRREIETAVDEKRNIIPVFFEGFNFGAPSIANKLTGKLATLNRYNGLDVHAGYFPEAMERLRKRYLNIPLEAVLHPVPTEVRKKVKEEQAAVNRALEQQRESIRELLDLYDDKQEPAGTYKFRRQTRLALYWGIGAGILLLLTLGMFGIRNLIQNSVIEETPAVAEASPERTVALSTPTITVTTPPATVTNSPIPTPQYDIGSTMISPKDSMTLLYVPGGSFTMGADADDALAKCQNFRSHCERDWFLDVEPAHLVNLDGYWIDETEVTTGMYQLCVEAGRCKEPRTTSSASHDSYYGNPEFENHPMIYVDWNMAKTYCEWADRRLPTEAEWEKAARGENAWLYPWGDTFDGSLLNFCDASCTMEWAINSFDDKYEDVAPVGSYPAGQSVYGVQDMAGNVLEWVEDWYDAYPGNTNDNGNYGTIFRVFRGGSWGNNELAAQSINRGFYAPARPNGSIGFRCALSE